MKRVDATSAKNRFGELLEACAQAPVAIVRHGRTVAYVVAPSQFGTTPAPTLEEQIAERLRACRARYATLFGSLARGTARKDSDIDVAVSFGKPMSADLRAAVIGMVADISGRSVDLIDLESAQGLVLARALAGKELLCDDTATREHFISRALLAEDEQLSLSHATRAARASLFA